MIISNYNDGTTRTGALTMSSSGNFLIGGGNSDIFQNDYKLSVNGSANINTNLTVGGITELRNRWARYNTTDGAAVNTNSFGTSTPNTSNTSYLTGFASSGYARIGESFVNESSGIFTFQENGTYNIRVTITTENVNYLVSQDRLTMGFFISIDNLHGSSNLPGHPPNTSAGNTIGHDHRESVHELCVCDRQIRGRSVLIFPGTIFIC